MVLCLRQRATTTNVYAKKLNLVAQMLKQSLGPNQTCFPDHTRFNHYMGAQRHNSTCRSSVKLCSCLARAIKCVATTSTYGPSYPCQDLKRMWVIHLTDFKHLCAEPPMTSLAHKGIIHLIIHTHIWAKTSTSSIARKGVIHLTEFIYTSYLWENLARTQAVTCDDCQTHKRHSIQDKLRTQRGHATMYFQSYLRHDARGKFSAHIHSKRIKYILAKTLLASFARKWGVGS
jgi:hypothetical protein